MQKTIVFSGFCPTLNKDYSIEVRYSHITGNRYLQSGGKCEYGASNPCPNESECPIRAKAPREKTI